MLFSSHLGKTHSLKIYMYILDVRKPNLLIYWHKVLSDIPAPCPPPPPHLLQVTHMPTQRSWLTLQPPLSRSKWKLGRVGCFFDSTVIMKRSISPHILIPAPGDKGVLVQTRGTFKKGRTVIYSSTGHLLRQPSC